MKRMSDEHRGNEFNSSEWRSHSAVNENARAFALLQRPLSDAQPYQQERAVWKNVVAPHSNLAAKAAQKAAETVESIKDTLEEMEDMADLYMAAGHFYSDAGVKQLRTLQSLKKLVAMRQFKLKSMALREEIAQKHVH